MGLLLRRRRRCKIQARKKIDGITSCSSRDKPQNSSTSPLQRDATSCCQQIVETERCPLPYLPEDIWRHIHSLMPLRDAARAACACHAFRCSWRSFPNLTFSKQTLGLKESANARGKDEIARDFTSRVDHIMKNHSGSDVKALKLVRAPMNYVGRYQRLLDSWLNKAVTTGMEELTFDLAHNFSANKYRFPCAVLSRGGSIRHLSLAECVLRPTVGFDCLRSLVRLDLFSVYIKGEDLGCLLSSSLALESLDLNCCPLIAHVKIPCLLRRLTHLSVTSCRKLQDIESKAPNLSSFHFESEHRVQVSLGAALQVKKLYVDCSLPISESRAELASTTQNLEPGLVHPSNENEMVSSPPLVSTKFLYLERLSITLSGSTFSQTFDYSSTVPPPSLETFISDVSRRLMEHPIYDEIRFFSHARTWVHLTCHMIRAWLSSRRICHILS